MTDLSTIMMKQPITNIGMLGSVSDGKSTTVYQLTGTKTQKHSKEQKRNITIKPGYANMKIYENNEELASSNSSKKVEGKLVNHISFIDCPGHYELIMTMLANIDLMKGAIVIVSAAESINKKPQLLQHLMAVKMANFKNVIICFNKLDLVTKKVALERKEELDKLLSELKINPKVIIPVCMNKKLGIDYLLDNIMEYFPPVIQDDSSDVQFRISRSFDINKKNIHYKDIKGGVLGGSLVSGKLKVGDSIEIKPGIIKKKEDGTFECITIKTKVMSLQTDTEQLDSIIPGGLIGIGTTIDPFYCKDDNLSGNIIGLEGTLPSVYNDINVELKYNNINFSDEEWTPQVGESINLQISTCSVTGTVKEFNSKLNITLNKPVCIDKTMMIIISRTIDKSLSILGYGFLVD